MLIKETLFSLKEQQYLELKLYQEHFPNLEKNINRA